jgi:hypothetical protein
MMYEKEGKVKTPVKVADGADVDETKNAFEVGKGRDDAFKVGKGRDDAFEVVEGENQADDADIDDDTGTFEVGEGENQDVENTNDVTGTDTDEGIEVKRMTETALVSAEIGGGFVDASGLNEMKSNKAMSRKDYIQRQKAVEEECQRMKPKGSKALTSTRTRKMKELHVMNGNDAEEIEEVLEEDDEEVLKDAQDGEQDKTSKPTRLIEEMSATACSYEIGLTAAEMAGKDTAKWEKAVDEKHEQRKKQSLWDEKLQKGSKVRRARMNARGYDEQVDGVHYDENYKAAQMLVASEIVM